MSHRRKLWSDFDDGTNGFSGSGKRPVPRGWLSPKARAGRRRRAEARRRARIRRATKTVRVVVDYDAFPTRAAAERAAIAAAREATGLQRGAATITKRGTTR